MVVKRKKVVKKTARKSTQGAGLKKFRLAIKKATKVVDTRLKKKLAEVERLKKLKKVAVKKATARLKKKRK